jgi:uracil-DNA glycosylase family protein
MISKGRRKQNRSAADFLPPSRCLSALKKAAAACRGCDLYKNGTQTVFGEGPKEASVMFVGEQPGDVEDRTGRPFVGPAGRIFDKALAEIAMQRDQVYVTNAVKHFKWTPVGKRRKHQRPLASEIAACKPWLSAEAEVIRPQVLVCLGATAAQSVLERKVSIEKERGRFSESKLAPATFITVHPSVIYRRPEKEQQNEEYRRFVGEMKLVKRKLLELKSERKKDKD